jgi:hypothetical protein
VIEVSIAELFEILNKRSDYIGIESAPPGLKVPAGGLASSFTLDDLRNVATSAQYGTTREELISDIDDYPIELHALFKGWAGDGKISFDAERDLVRLD